MLFQTVNLSAICECWVAEHVDEWTDEKSIVLICSDEENESAIGLFDNRKVVFYDGTARQQKGSLVSWSIESEAVKCTASTYFGIATPNRQISEAKVISLNYFTASRTVIRFVFGFDRSEHLILAG